MKTEAKTELENGAIFDDDYQAFRLGSGVEVLAKKDDKGAVTAELPNIPVKKQRPALLKKKVNQETKTAVAPKAQKVKADTATAAPATPISAQATPAVAVNKA